MTLEFGRDICTDLSKAETREWLVTNGIGGYASGTLAGLNTRRYHGLLIAALEPPLGRTLLLSQFDETADYNHQSYALHTRRWMDGILEPQGYQLLERFFLEGTVPVWQWRCGDALLEKRIWMQQGANTTYIQYRLLRASQLLRLSLKAFVNYRDYHSDTQINDWPMRIHSVNQGLKITAFAGATPFYLLSQDAPLSPAHQWYRGFDLAVERYRGLQDHEDHFHIGTFNAVLHAGESVLCVASTESAPNLEGDPALHARQRHEHRLLDQWAKTQSAQNSDSPTWIKHLVLAADQFIVDRPLSDRTSGKTVIAGYPWFSDWGRDTMISLPGLTLVTGRPEIARAILKTFAQSVSQGMVPNRFPDAGQIPEYNTVDATLWYFEAIRTYLDATGDEEILQELFPVLADMIEWHCQGTRYRIHLDSNDGLLYAGEPGVQLTWMDAKAGDWVVTPRIGKPIEINALWYNALRIMVTFAQRLGLPHQTYEAIASQAQSSFQKFWNPELGYCHDVIDGPEGADSALRPNQLFAMILPKDASVPLLSFEQQKSVVEVCRRALLTPYGLRSLGPEDPQYQGRYGGTLVQRDGAYHQGTVWGWLLGPFVQAHFKVYGDRDQARQFLEPMGSHLNEHGVGSLSEIFDGNEPMTPRGCIAQAWSVAEVLQAWVSIQ